MHRVGLQLFASGNFMHDGFLDHFFKVIYAGKQAVYTESTSQILSKAMFASSEDSLLPGQKVLSFHFLEVTLKKLMMIRHQA